MPRTIQSKLHLYFALLTTTVALLTSCGPSGLRPASPDPQIRLTEIGTLLTLPGPRTPMIATMRFIDGSMADEIRANFESAPTDTVPVSFRLGPKMPVLTFPIALDGKVDLALMKQLRRLFRCRRSRRTHRINSGLLAKIADLASHYPGHTLEIVSAYRHGRNATPNSRHRHGRAIDIRVVGVPAAQVRDYLWARYEVEVGVGFYKQQQFIHLDHRANYPATAWTQRSHNGENNYRPRWARADRRSRLVVSLVDIESP